jgi:hypothetical protein
MSINHGDTESTEIHGDIVLWNMIAGAFYLG